MTIENLKHDIIAPGVGYAVGLAWAIAARGLMRFDGSRA